VYDPITDNWTPTATIGAPSPRFWHTAVWTGEQMVVWGGNPLTDTGGRYDPVSDSWTATSSARPPAARYNHTAVWTGSEMIVWGGWAGSFTRSGGRYDPQADRWTPGGVEQAGSPAPRSNHTAVWTGNEMIVWGGVPAIAQGGIYNPATGSWRSMLKEGSPAPRLGHTAVWTGEEMIVWGGNRGGALDDGARFDPATGINGAWSALATDGAPQQRFAHTAVWAGNEMIVWGGFDETSLSSGGRYDPQTDSWLPGGTTAEGAPSSRAGHTAAWSGAGMIVWGGFGAEYLQTGGIFSTAPPAPGSKGLRVR
jgi:N-acetylneuraminic acid mutarotase